MRKNAITYFAVIPFLLVMMWPMKTADARDQLVIDYATPEAAFDTFFYALKHHMSELTLDSMSNDFQLFFGKDREEQLFTLREKVPYEYYPDLHATAKRVERNGKKAMVAYQTTLGDRVLRPLAFLYMMEMDGEWKVVVPDNMKEMGQKVIKAFLGVGAN